MLTKKELIDHINETYNLSPEYIFKKFPDYCVFRHQKSKKWFGVLMSVPEEKIYDGASDHRIINILDLKVDPELGGILRGKEGYFPAYHMNKELWKREHSRRADCKQFGYRSRVLQTWMNFCYKSP